MSNVCSPENNLRKNNDNNAIILAKRATANT